METSQLLGAGLATRTTRTLGEGLVAVRAGGWGGPGAFGPDGEISEIQFRKV